MVCPLPHVGGGDNTVVPAAIGVLVLIPGTVDIDAAVGHDVGLAVGDVDVHREDGVAAVLENALFRHGGDLAFVLGLWFLL